MSIVKWLNSSLCVITAGIALCVSASTLRANPKAVAGPVTVVGQISMPSGSPDGSIVILTVPQGFHFVGQTVSYFRSGAVAGSIGNLFIEVNYSNANGYVAAPEAVADGSAYPSATLNATFYCAGVKPIVINAYRSGSLSAQETVNVVMTGNYVAN